MLRFENDDGRSLFCKLDLMVKWVHGQGKRVWYGYMVHAIIAVQIIVIKLMIKNRSRQKLSQIKT